MQRQAQLADLPGGLGGPGVALVTVPVVIVWLLVSLSLARMHAERAKEAPAKAPT